MRRGKCIRSPAGARTVLALAILFALAAVPVERAGAADPAPVFDLVDQRLELMKGVAAYKYLNDIAVEDLEREAVVLARAREKAEAVGLDGALIERFFERNIDAAKAIQRCWIGRWSAGAVAAPTRAPDLKAEIRPQLIDVGNRLTQAIATHVKAAGAVDATSRDGFDRRVAVECLDGNAAGALFDALREVRAAGP